MSLNDADGMANSVDPDQTAIWVCTVCPDIAVRKLRIITISVRDIMLGLKSFETAGFDN